MAQFHAQFEVGNVAVSEVRGGRYYAIFVQRESNDHYSSETSLSRTWRTLSFFSKLIFKITFGLANLCFPILVLSNCVCFKSNTLHSFFKFSVLSNSTMNLSLTHDNNIPFKRLKYMLVSLSYRFLSADQARLVQIAVGFVLHAWVTR